MPLDAAHPLVQLTDRKSVAEHAWMIVGHRVAQGSDAGGEVVELAVMPRHRAGDSRQQLVDGCDIRPVWTTHAITLAVVTRLGQALRVPRSRDLPCDKVC